MRHLRTGKKLGRTSKHRIAMTRNLVTSLIDEERVRTTLAKAKEVRRHAERIITIGRKGTLHARRLAAAYLMTPEGRIWLDTVLEMLAAGKTFRRVT